MYFSLYCKGSKRVTQGFMVRGSWNWTELQYIDPHSYGRQYCVFLVLLILNQRPGGSAFCWVLALSTTYYQQQISETTGGPLGPFGLVWPSLPHLVYNSNSDFLSWLSYIIVQRPINRPLNLWNGIFDRHQAEITVMQFTGNSLPVHQSMSVPWDFFFCLVPFHQPNPA